LRPWLPHVHAARRSQGGVHLKEFMYKHKCCTIVAFCIGMLHHSCIGLLQA
jgi:hypothetical protein